MVYYTLGSDEKVKFDHIKDAKASARKKLVTKEATAQLRIFKWKISLDTGLFYGSKVRYREWCGLVSKVTDPDGLVVYLYCDIKITEITPYRTDYLKGPVRILEKDGSSSKIVSANRWTECREL